MAIRTLIFDFGNVLGFFDHRRTLQRLVPFTDLTVEEMFAAVYSSDLGEAYESGRLSTPEFLTRAQQLCRLRCEHEVIARAFADIFWPNEEVCALVPLLRQRYRLVLGSNTNDLHSRHFRQQFSATLQHFAALVLSHEVGACKPLAAFYQRCQVLADCPAEECLFIDDLALNVEGARQTGLQGLVYRQGELRRELQALGVMLC